MKKSFLSEWLNSQQTSWVINVIICYYFKRNIPSADATLRARDGIAFITVQGDTWFILSSVFITMTCAVFIYMYDKVTNTVKQIIHRQLKRTVWTVQLTEIWITFITAQNAWNYTVSFLFLFERLSISTYCPLSIVYFRIR